MKIKKKEMKYEDVLTLPAQKRKKPKHPSFLLNTLIRVLAISDLKATSFTYQEIGMEKLGKKDPCLILMNHSSFIDLKIASAIFYPRPYNIVCTSDGFVGKDGLMRRIGCIPTKKFIMDTALVRDMTYAVRHLKNSILLFPEASYSFDGTATPLPDSLGKCLKILDVPVVMVKTTGAFTRDPLYNNLQLRDVKVSAEVKYLLSPEDISRKSVTELNEIIRNEFTFDNFKWQQENNICVAEEFRADQLNRVLYRCCHCDTEGRMVGKGITVHCEACGATYELTKKGYLKCTSGETKFTHIPDWYAWERQCVREELERGSYLLDVAVDICMMVDTNCIYQIGEGRLVHNNEGFHLTGCEGKLDYRQKPSASYSLYSDYYWYEIGDMICIGNTDALYYCFPKEGGDVVAKTRLAAEELYKLTRKKKDYSKAES